jgi:nicotinamidase-related amidase
MKKIIQGLLPCLLIVSSFVVNGQTPSPELLNPTNHTLVMIDHEGQMAFATQSIPIDQLRNNAALVAGASKIFKVATVITTVAERSFSGPVFPEILEFYPQATSGFIDRTTMNTWEDTAAYKAITGKGKKKIVFAGLWTSVCIVGPALSAKSEGYDVYVITDACGDVNKEAHERGIERMIQAGIKPMTSTQYLLELQRDWSRQATYKAVNDLVQKYGGAYGIGVQYARDMLKH